MIIVISYLSRSLQKAILQFYSILLHRLADSSLPTTTTTTTTTTGGRTLAFNPVPLIRTLDQCLDVAGSPNYYDIPLLELSLECLLHLTDK